METRNIIDFNTYEYKVKKKKPIKVEQIPAPKMTSVFKTKIADPRYQYVIKNDGTSRRCHVCGAEEAVVICWFQLRGCQKLERYCEKCLKVWIQMPAPAPAPETVPNISK